MSSLAQLEEEKQQYQEQLDLVAGQIRDDPENAELQALHEELKNVMKIFDEEIAELKPKQAPKPAPKEASPAPEPAKWSRDSHPASKKNTAPVEEKEEPVVNYQVNDTVLAKWLSGDKAFYPARITSITGSSTDPIYIVKFKTYDTTETLRSRDIRPISNKRKADAPSTTTTTTPPVATPPAPGLVSSAGATVYPEAKKEAEKEKDLTKPPKAKKIKANKELEAGKFKWQDFNNKSKFGKSNKKESMFRTPEGIRGRVGFTGSGKAMSKDPTRSRHVYQVNEELD